MSTPEQKVRTAVRRFMEDRGWELFLTHGNRYQAGFPDAYALHPHHGDRWIDFKVAGKYSFTKAQKNVWCNWHFNLGKSVYILTAGTQAEYDKLSYPGNFLDYWRDAWGCAEEFAKPFDPTDLIETLSGEWRPVQGFSKYHVSQDGCIASEASGRLLSPEVCDSGHLRVTMCKRGEKRRAFVHTLVLEAFQGLAPPGMQCCHIDGNPSNNLLGNLMWGTSQENAIHRSIHGNAPTAKLTEDDIKLIVGSNLTVEELSKQFLMSRHSIQDILEGRTWSWLTGLVPKPSRRRLTSNEVIEVFKSQGTHREIAGVFGINHGTVGAIKRRHSHRSITEGL